MAVWRSAIADATHPDALMSSAVLDLRAQEFQTHRSHTDKAAIGRVLRPTKSHLPPLAAFRYPQHYDSSVAT